MKVKIVEYSKKTITDDSCSLGNGSTKRNVESDNILL